MIEYSDLQAARLSDIHKLSHDNDMVLGWAMWSVGPGHTVMEMLYARTWDGRNFETGPHLKGNDFDNASRKWQPVQTIPKGAEFIGTYRKPSACR